MSITNRASTDRSNTGFAVIVDQALAISSAQGAHAAARFLREHGAAFALTVRVLAEPKRRRPRP